MMLGSSSFSSLFGNSAPGEAPQDSAKVGGGAGENPGVGFSFSDEGKDGRTEEGERGGGSGGNRWPRQETMVLLKLRSEMGVSFRHSNLKGPLWEEISRKMAQLGYQRSGKKCKEKFENVYKYHKRTKDGRAAKANGKSYRFFEELKALETYSPCPISTLPPPPAIFPNLSLLSDYSTSSSSSLSDEDTDKRKRRKRKMKSFLERLMNDVMRKQEESQKKILDTLEKLERDRIVREEAWRVQEMARMNHLAQERSMAADKDKAMMTLLQKMLGQKSPSTTNNDINVNIGENLMTPSLSRWPKAEVEALITLRTNLDKKYSDNVPKGPLWQEISVEMNKMGYNRSSKRCKEKWENINKYYKKMKENCNSSSKKRLEDSKTCPYFLQLDALYTSKTKTPTIQKPGSPENPMMVRPVQQWLMPQGQEPALGEEELTLVDDQERQGGAYVETNKQQLQLQC